ncbi:MAG: hypothetical protein ACOYKZ_03770, partial [Chlamydiia bacterium]
MHKFKSLRSPPNNVLSLHSMITAEGHKENLHRIDRLPTPDKNFTTLKSAFGCIYETHITRLLQ